MRDHSHRRRADDHGAVGIAHQPLEHGPNHLRALAGGELVSEVIDQHGAGEGRERLRRGLGELEIRPPAQVELGLEIAEEPVPPGSSHGWQITWRRPRNPRESQSG